MKKKQIRFDKMLHEVSTYLAWTLISKLAMG